MAAMVGSLGSITIGTTVLGAGTELRLRRWDFAVAKDALEITAFLPTSNMREFLGGLASGSGSFDGWADSAAAPLSVAQWEETTGQTLSTITLLGDGVGNQYVFTALLSEVSMATAVNEIISVSGRFVSSGVIVPTWA